jgi:LPS-assembly protein
VVRNAQNPLLGGRDSAVGGRRWAMRLAATLVCLLALHGVVGVAPALAQQRPSAFPRTPAPKFTAPSKLDKQAPLLLNGDELTYDNSGNRVIAKGNVELYYSGYSVTADEVIYDQGANTLTAAGNVTIKDPNGQITHADRIDITDDFKDGFVDALSVVLTDDTRIAGRSAIRKGGSITEFKDAKYSPCKSTPGMPPLWCISAARIIHDEKAATISYQDAQFELLGLPVVYLPFFEHPDPSVKRRSGFLIPSVGQSSTLGTMVEIPYYFALSPQYDVLFSPQYLSAQGLLLKADFRHRLANGAYEVKLAGIDQDSTTLPGDKAANSKYDGLRGSLETKGLFSLSSWWRFGWDVTVESDDTFRRFYKLDGALVTDRINTVFLDGQTDRNYFGVKFQQFGGLLLTDSKLAESRVHPVVDYDYVFKNPVLGGELSWSSNVLSLTRDGVLLDNAGAVKQTFSESYNHVKSDLKWRRRMTDQLGISYTPFADLRGDLYYLDNAINPVTGKLISDQTITRGVGTAGITVNQPWIASGPRGSHTIEPIGQVLISQAKVSQQALPNEDARSVVFDDTNLFEIQKFSGTDRVETGTRANVGVQYTFQANDGGYARFLAGQHIQLSGNNAYKDPGTIIESTQTVSGDTITYSASPHYVFSPSSGLQTNRSDYVLGAYFAPNAFFRLLSQSRFSENDLQLRREDLFSSINYGPVGVYGVYSYVAADPLLGTNKAQSELLGSASFKLTDRWDLIGSLRYDIDAQKVLTDSIALRYADDCFVLTATYQETFLDNAALGLKSDQLFMLRFELKNLGGYGYRTSTLENAVSSQTTPTR